MQTVRNNQNLNYNENIDKASHQNQISEKS
jgi:hypothetical protein